MVLSLNFGFLIMDYMTLRKLLFSELQFFIGKIIIEKKHTCFLLCDDQIREAKFQCLKQRLTLSEKF